MSSLPPVEKRTLHEAFERALARHPDKVALVAGGQTWTFDQSYRRALQLGSGLAHYGCAPDAPLALMLDNSADFVHLWMGAGLTGLVEVPVNTGYRGSFLAHILNDSAAEVLVIEHQYLDRLTLIAKELHTLHTVIVRAGNTESAPAPFTTVHFDDLLDHGVAEPVRRRAGDLMALMYTSGTTGASKGVETTQAHAYTYASREDQSRPSANDRILVNLPLFHIAGQWYGTYQALIAGSTCYLEPRFSVSDFWSSIRRHSITTITMLGAMAELLQQSEPTDDDADNPLELTVMAPLASDPESFSSRFGVTLEPVYGMSEIGALLGSYGTGLLPGEAGVARNAEYELRLVDGEGNEVPDGEVGELWVKPRDSRVGMAGYHGLPEKSAETIRDGWIVTGDAFRCVDGHYFFVDRIKDALRRRGENISSFEVERVINSYPNVYESAVVAVPSKLTEDEIKAVIVPRDGSTVDPAALTEFLIEHQPHFMVPRYITVVDALPKTPTLKIQKHLIRSDTVHSTWDREAAGINVRKGK